MKLILKTVGQQIVKIVINKENSLDFYHVVYFENITGFVKIVSIIV